MLDPGHAEPDKRRRQHAEQRISGPVRPVQAQPDGRQHGQPDREDPGQLRPAPRIFPRHREGHARQHGDGRHDLHRVQRVVRNRLEVRAGRRPGLAGRRRGERVGREDHRSHDGQGAGDQPHAEPGGLAPGDQLDQPPGQPQRREQLGRQLDRPERGQAEATGEPHALRGERHRQPQGRGGPQDQVDPRLMNAPPSEHTCSRGGDQHAREADQDGKRHQTLWCMTPGSAGAMTQGVVTSCCGAGFASS